MATLDTILMLAGIDLPNCPKTAIRLAAIQAAIEFCEKSLALTKKTTITLVDQDDDYAITGDANRRVVQVWWVKKPTADLTPLNNQQVASIKGADKQYGEPTHFYQADHTVLNVWRCPQTNNGAGLALTVNAAYAPTHAATSLNETVFERYIDALVAGAQAIRMRDIGKPWSNPNEAMSRRGQLLSAIDSARIAAMQANTTSTSRIEFVPFGFA